MKKTILWCCVERNFKDGPNYDHTTLSYTRSESIKKCIGHTHTTMNWRWYKSKGWACVKVTIDITPFK